jgi:DNA-binding transcriptional regulator YiaG
MTTFASALKDEMRRLARKEVKAQTRSTTQAVGQYRKDISQLKRQVRDLEKKLSFLHHQERKRLAAPTSNVDSNDGARFSAKSVKSQRAKTGLSAASYAKLVGVSALTVYNWENGKTKPRKEQLTALVALRGIGKREAKAKLALMNGKKRRR